MNSNFVVQPKTHVVRFGLVLFTAPSASNPPAAPQYTTEEIVTVKINKNWAKDINTFFYK
jgi:hypothetical protein